MFHTLSARRLITASETIELPVISIDDDGMIAGIEPGAASPATDTTLTTTFFDVHTHGAANHDVMEGTPEALSTVSRFMATRGVGHYLPTTVTAPVEKTLVSLEGISRAIDLASTADWNPRFARPVGIHLEGPFISHSKRGVHPPEYILAPDIKLFDRLQQAAGGHIRLITIAPEIPGAIDLIRHCIDQKVRISIGHTDATSAETHAAIEAGATSATHTYNAMRPLNHREPGVLGTVLDSNQLFAELICDGVHVAPELVRLWLKAKGTYRAILVTDSMAAAGMPDGDYTLGTFAVRVANGRAFAADDLSQGQHTLAGSVLTLDRAVANLQLFTGASLETAVGLASYNPASMLGMERTIANVAVDEPANFNVFDAAGNLQQTVLYGTALT
jgi:N-acetylglucosamine-6-phosphate deacetylase